MKTKTLLYPCFNWPGTIWLYTDPHFGDIDAYLYRFPEKFSLSRDINIREQQLLPSDLVALTELDNLQIKNINRKVGKKDTIIFLGDVGNIECIREIHGYKVLIQGNHDNGPSYYSRSTHYKEIDCDDYLPITPNECWIQAKKLYPSDEIQQEICVEQIQQDAYLKAKESLSKDSDFISLDNTITYTMHKPFMYWIAKYDNRLFDEVYKGCLLINEKILLSHEPADFPFALNVHGHDHSGAFLNSYLKYFDSDDNNIFKNQLKTIKLDHLNKLNICPEFTNYEPISLKSIYESGVLHDIVDIHRETIDNASKTKT